MYIKRTVTAGNVIFVDKYFSYRYGKKSSRGENVNLTSDEQKKINEKHKIERLKWIMCANFKKNDWWVTLTYRISERPADINAGHKNLNTMIGKLRRKEKVNGNDIYYMGVTERGKKGGVHHHIIIRNNIDISQIIKLWTYGKVIIDDCYTDNMLTLSGYYTKGDSEEAEKRYTKSRNLIIPVPKKEIIKADSWRKHPKPTKTHEPIEIYSGVNECGYEFQRYIMVRRE